MGAENTRHPEPYETLPLNPAKQLVAITCAPCTASRDHPNYNVPTDEPLITTINGQTSPHPISVFESLIDDEPRIRALREEMAQEGICNISLLIDDLDVKTNWMFPPGYDLNTIDETLGRFIERHALLIEQYREHGITLTITTLTDYLRRYELSDWYREAFRAHEESIATGFFADREKSDSNRNPFRSDELQRQVADHFGLKKSREIKKGYRQRALKRGGSEYDRLVANTSRHFASYLTQGDLIERQGALYVPLYPGEETKMTLAGARFTLLDGVYADDVIVQQIKIGRHDSHQEVFNARARSRLMPYLKSLFDHARSAPTEANYRERVMTAIRNGEINVKPGSIEAAIITELERGHYPLIWATHPATPESLKFTVDPIDTADDEDERVVSMPHVRNAIPVFISQEVSNRYVGLKPHINGVMEGWTKWRFLNQTGATIIGVDEEEGGYVRLLSDVKNNPGLVWLYPEGKARRLEAADYDTNPFARSGIAHLAVDLKTDPEFLDKVGCTDTSIIVVDQRDPIVTQSNSGDPAISAQSRVVGIYQTPWQTHADVDETFGRFGVQVAEAVRRSRTIKIRSARSSVSQGIIQDMHKERITRIVEDHGHSPEYEAALYIDSRVADPTWFEEALENPDLQVGLSRYLGVPYVTATVNKATEKRLIAEIISSARHNLQSTARASDYSRYRAIVGDVVSYMRDLYALKAPYYTSTFDRLSSPEQLAHLLDIETIALNMMRIVDIGCGPGDNIRRITPEKGKSIGLDLSLPMIHEAMRRGTIGQNISGLVGSATSIPLADGSSEITTAMYIADRVEDPRVLIRELHRVTTDDGHVVVANEFPFDNIGNPDGDIAVSTGFFQSLRLFMDVCCEEGIVIDRWTLARHYSADIQGNATDTGCVLLVGRKIRE